MKNKIINSIFKVLEPKRPKNQEYWDLINIKAKTINFQLHQLLPDMAAVIKARIKYFFKYKSISFLAKAIIAAAVLFVCYTAFIKSFAKEIEYRYLTSKSYPYRPITDSTMTQRNFLKTLRIMESGDNYLCFKQESQFWGAYQIGNDARQATGFSTISLSQFLRDKEFQDICVVRCMKLNRERLKPYLHKWPGKWVNKTFITESGIIGMAQMAPGYVENFFNHAIQISETDTTDYYVNPEYVSKDGNKKPCTDYLKNLGGFKLTY